MPASNRAALIGKLQTALKKHYKSAPPQPNRPLLEHVLYASLLEDAPADLADEGMAKCEQEFFDWNEVRVTTATELSQVLSRLPDPGKAARRLKSNLQAIFEEFYTFDLDHLKKENLGKAVAKFEKMPGMTPFVLNYTIQHGLGGHAIPVDYSAMVIMLATEIASQPEAMSGKVPGLERAIPKSKAIEFSALLHQAAVALHKSTKDKTARTMIDAVNKGSSGRLDDWLKSRKAAKKRVVKRKAEEKAAAKAAEFEAAKEAERAAKAAAEAKLAKEKRAKEAAAKAAAKAAAMPKKEVVKKAAKEVVKKAAPAKQKKTVSKPAKKTPSSKTKKKPAKAATKKAATKKSSAKATKRKTAKKAPAKKAPATKAKKKAPVKKKTTKKKATKKVTKKKAPAKKSSKKSSNRKLTKRKPR